MSSGAANRPGRGNVEWAEAVLLRFADQGPAGVVDQLDPEVEVHADEALANAGTFHGVPGFLRWIERWLDAWEEFTIEVEMIEPVGSRHVVATVRQVGVGKSSGLAIDMGVAYMFEVEGGRAVRLHLYGERKDAIAAARRG